MAKARKKYKPADRPREPKINPGFAATVFSPDELAKLRAVADYLTEARAKGRAQADQLARAREIIDRHAAIRDGLVKPPWMSEEKPEGRQVARIKAVLPELFPNGRPPDGMPDKVILHDINAAFDKRGWKHASRDSMARAFGRRR